MVRNPIPRDHLEPISTRNLPPTDMHASLWARGPKTVMSWGADPEHKLNYEHGRPAPPPSQKMQAYRIVSYRRASGWVTAAADGRRNRIFGGYATASCAPTNQPPKKRKHRKA